MLNRVKTMIANLLNDCNSISLISNDTDKEIFQRQDGNCKQNVHVNLLRYRSAGESFLYLTIDAGRRSAMFGEVEKVECDNESVLIGGPCSWELSLVGRKKKKREGVCSVLALYSRRINPRQSLVGV